MGFEMVDDRDYKKTILVPNKITDIKTGLDKYILTWCQISEIIETEIECRKLGSKANDL